MPTPRIIRPRYYPFENIVLIRLVATRNALIITIREYEPSVDCEPRAPQVPDYDSCELALQAVPASRFVRAFVSSGYREPDRGVTKLPKEYADTSGRCESASVVFARPDCPHIIAAIQGGWVVR